MMLLAALAVAVPAFAQAPGADQVADVLAKSKGTWVTTKMPDGTSVKIWQVLPESSAKTGVVLVIHENQGLNDWPRAVADQLARDGFIALAVDMLSGMGPGGGGTAELGAGAGQAIRNVTPDMAKARLDAAMAYGKTLPQSNGKTATIGFCWGGGQSFRYAVAQPELNAAVVYYGPSPDLAALSSVRAPVLGLYGGNDNARINGSIEPVSAEMKKLGKSHTFHIYEGAGHGFLRQQNQPANATASQQAWPATLSFLREHLK
jgi:carboxymethylenebutenolidase